MDDQLLNKQPWFHGLLPREEVKLLLVCVGDFLVRRSEPSPGRPRHVVLSMLQVQGESEGMHYVIAHNDGRYSITEKESFATLNELLTHHKVTPINESVPTSVLVAPIGRQSWELNHEDIQTTKVLGEGAFGEVKAGTLKTSNGVVNVAIKVAKLEKCTKEQIREITTEARLMRRFDHKNVVRCYGVAAIEEPLYVVMELVPGGGLDGVLQKTQMAMTEKLDVISQVAAGLAYIHSQNIMHRDIAARNVLYGNACAKVSDFGLSRVGTSYQMGTDKKAPIRWLSPETMSTSTYTQFTDVFAFGVLCWEVLENAATPYPGLLVQEVRNKVVLEDYRMAISDKAPPALVELMKKCWIRDISLRPTMEQVRQLAVAMTKNQPAPKTKSNNTISAERARIMAPTTKGNHDKALSGPRQSRVEKTNRRAAHQHRRKPPSSAAPSTGGSSGKSLSAKVVGPVSPAGSENTGGGEKHHRKKRSRDQ